MIYDLLSPDIVAVKSKITNNLATGHGKFTTRDSPYQFSEVNYKIIVIFLINSFLSRWSQSSITVIEPSS